VAILLTCSFLLSKENKAKHEKRQVPTLLNTFTVTDTGFCQFGQQYFQLLANSKTSFLGCWLVLSSVEKTLVISAEQKKLFIYKDSLSNQDYARVCRIIKHLNT